MDYSQKTLDLFNSKRVQDRFWLHRGVIDLAYKGAHTIRVLWIKYLGYLVVTSTTLVPVKFNPNSSLDFDTAEEVVKWLFDNGRP